MQIPIIKTKLFIPPVHKQIVSRQRIVELINKGLDKKLTLISAQAGFGKTSLLSEFVPQSDRLVAWISLDEGDNDPYRFLAYFISAIREIFPGIGESVLAALNASQPLETGSLLTGLINEIVEVDDFVIVLDDYHTIANEDVHEIITFILENQPPGMHFIISTRADPPWPLGRWRARREILEIRAKELRFTLEESADLLNNIMRLDLNSEEIQMLDTRTEGWVAGLVMAASSLDGREDPAKFIRTFVGSNRFIFDYLIEDVLGRLPLNIQGFLLRTSILQQLCAPLCDRILESQESQSILVELEQKNLFIVPLDDQRNWYRYHHLFSDLLVGLLKERYAEEVESLHRRASIWYEANNFLFEAVDHAFAVDDINRAAKLVSEDVLGIIERGELGLMVQKLDRLPDKLFVSHPWLRVARAWAGVQTGDLEAVNYIIANIEDSLQESDTITGDQVRHIMGHIMAIRCFIELISIGDYTLAADLGRRALDFLPASDLKTRGKVMVYLGTLQRIQQDLPLALETLTSALSIYKPTNQLYVVLDIMAQIARVKREQGLLHETARVCQEALSIAESNARDGQLRLPVAAYIMGVSGRIYYEWNQLGEAFNIGTQALALSKGWGQANTLMGNYLFLSRIYRANGKFQEALNAVQEAKKVGERFSDTHAFVIGTHEIYTRMVMGDILAAEKWVARDCLAYDIDQNERLWELAPMIVVLYQEQRLDLLNDLLAALDHLLSSFKQKGINRRLIHAKIQKAVVLQALGNTDKALSCLDQAITGAEQEGYIRSFLDHGQNMDYLLKEGIAAGINVHYAQMLLSILQNELSQKKLNQGYRKPRPMIEILTKRENEVLRLLAADMTIPEIADLLVISTGTLRTHIKHIYRKLGTHSRYEAVTRGKEFGML